MTLLASPDSSSVARAARFSRFTSQVTDCTRVEPRPMRVARAILGRPASHPPAFPKLFGIGNPVGVSTRAVAKGGWFITLSRMTS